MNTTYTSYDQLPLSLCANDVAAVLNISRANAYTLMHSKDFPTITIGKQRVGELKEGFDFISAEKAPAEVIKLRDAAASVEDESLIFEEKIMLYRKHLTIDDVALAANADYPMRGINEIMRLHLTRFTQKMDNPEVPIDVVDDQGNIGSVQVDKIYCINIVFQFQHDSEVEYHHFRITMTRDGVLRIDEI